MGKKPPAQAAGNKKKTLQKREKVKYPPSRPAYKLRKEGENRTKVGKAPSFRFGGENEGLSAAENP